MGPRLRLLGEGGYERAYIAGASQRKTGTHQLIAGLLESLKIPFNENVSVQGAPRLVADFLVNGTFVFVDREVGEEARKALLERGRNCVLITRDQYRSDKMDHGIRIIGLGEERGLQTIFLDDPAFNFDYSHILPKTQKCSVMHGHTSSVLVEVVGRPIEGMVVDFAVAKQIVKEAVRGLDHKLFINEKYVSSMDAKSVTLRFETVHGDFAIKAPKGTTVMMNGEATVENLAREVLGRIAPKMPENVSAVGVYVYEGMNKGSHILAKLHQDGVGDKRRKR